MWDGQHGQPVEDNTAHPSFLRGCSKILHLRLYLEVAGLWAQNTGLAPKKHDFQVHDRSKTSQRRSSSHRLPLRPLCLLGGFGKTVNQTIFRPESSFCAGSSGRLVRDLSYRPPPHLLSIQSHCRLTKRRNSVGPWRLAQDLQNPPSKTALGFQIACIWLTARPCLLS